MAGPAGIEPVTPGSPRRAKSLTRALTWLYRCSTSSGPLKVWLSYGPATWQGLDDGFKKNSGIQPGGVPSRYLKVEPHDRDGWFYNEEDWSEYSQRPVRAAQRVLKVASGSVLQSQCSVIVPGLIF